MQRIIVVDDEPGVRLSLVEILRGGWMVDTAADASAARRMLQAARYAAAVIDNRMPGGNGVDLAADFIAAGVPVVILSAYVDDELRTRARAVGVVAVIEKGPNMLALVDTLRRMTGPADIRDTFAGRVRRWLSMSAHDAPLVIDFA